MGSHRDRTSRPITTATVHLTQNDGRTVLNAEDFYATLVSASKRYFDDLSKDAALQAAFIERTKDPETGVLVVGPASVAP